jgi:hypothetical protein
LYQLAQTNSTETRKFVISYENLNSQQILTYANNHKGCNTIQYAKADNIKDYTVEEKCQWKTENYGHIGQRWSARLKTTSVSASAQL